MTTRPSSDSRGEGSCLRVYGWLDTIFSEKELKKIQHIPHLTAEGWGLISKHDWVDTIFSREGITKKNSTRPPSDSRGEGSCLQAYD